MTQHPVGRAAVMYADAFHITRDTLAAAAGVARSTLTRWFNGTTPIPLDCIPPLEQALRLPRGRLLVDAGYVDVDGNLQFDQRRHP